MKSYIFIEPKLEARQLLPRSEEDHSRSSASDIVTHSPFTDFLILPTKLKSTFSMWLAVIWLAGFTQLPKIRAGLFFYSVHLEIKSCLPVPSCKKFWRLRKPLFIIAVEYYWFLNLLTLLCNKVQVFRTSPFEDELFTWFTNLMASYIWKIFPRYLKFLSEEFRSKITWYPWAELHFLLCFLNYIYKIFCACYFWISIFSQFSIDFCTKMPCFNAIIVV